MDSIDTKSAGREVNAVVRWHVDTVPCEPYFYELYDCKMCLMVCPFQQPERAARAAKSCLRLGAFATLRYRLNP